MTADTPPRDISPATRRLLTGPILPTLLGLAWPNVIVMVAQASTGLIETWWVSHLGSDALAGMALVFPGYMMMTMLSGGAIGGGIASAVARASCPASCVRVTKSCTIEPSAMPASDSARVTPAASVR